MSLTFYPRVCGVIRKIRRSNTKFYTTHQRMELNLKLKVWTWITSLSCQTDRSTSKIFVCMRRWPLVDLCMHQAKLMLAPLRSRPARRVWRSAGSWDPGHGCTAQRVLVLVEWRTGCGRSSLCRPVWSWGGSNHGRARRSVSTKRGANRRWRCRVMSEGFEGDGVFLIKR
jgi:hypothetical protein